MLAETTHEGARPHHRAHQARPTSRQHDLLSDQRVEALARDGARHRASPMLWGHQNWLIPTSSVRSGVQFH